MGGQASEETHLEGEASERMVKTLRNSFDHLPEHEHLFAGELMRVHLNLSEKIH